AQQHAGEEPCGSRAQPIAEQRHQAEMETGNHHEVIGAGGAEKLPLSLRDAAAVANGERLHERTFAQPRAVRREQGVQARAEGMAQGVETAAGCLEQRIAAVLAYVAGRTETLLQQPGLVVE